MKVILISNSGISVKLVSSETEMNSLLSNSFEDYVIPGYIDLPNNLTAIYNDGDIDPEFKFENTIAKKITGYDLINPVVICRFIDPEGLSDLVDVLDVDIDEICDKLKANK